MRFILKQLQRVSRYPRIYETRMTSSGTITFRWTERPILLEVSRAQNLPLVFEFRSTSTIFRPTSTYEKRCQWCEKISFRYRTRGAQNLSYLVTCARIILSPVLPSAECGLQVSDNIESGTTVSTIVSYYTG